MKMQILGPTLRIPILKVWESALLSKHPKCFPVWPLVHTENVIIPELWDAIHVFFSKQVRWGGETYSQTRNLTLNHLSLVSSLHVAFLHVQWRFCISWNSHYQTARDQGCPGICFLCLWYRRRRWLCTWMSDGSWAGRQLLEHFPKFIFSFLHHFVMRQDLLLYRKEKVMACGFDFGIKAIFCIPFYWKNSPCWALGLSQRLVLSAIRKLLIIRLLSSYSAWL